MQKPARRAGSLLCREACNDAFRVHGAACVSAKEIQHHWMKETEAYVEQGLKTQGSLLDVNKVSAQPSYQLDLPAASRRAGWGGAIDGGTSREATAASIRRGSTTSRQRRNDTPALPGLSKEPSRKNGLSGRSRGDSSPVPRGEFLSQPETTGYLAVVSLSVESEQLSQRVPKQFPVEYPETLFRV